MQYTILIHESAGGFAARTDPKQQNAYWGGTMRYLQALKHAGVFVGGAGLGQGQRARVCRAIVG